jgi:predicted RNase H-like HicB family nuclease
VSDQEVEVRYHREGTNYWAEIPDIPGFSSAADDLVTLRQQVRDAVKEIRGADVELNELFGPGALVGVVSPRVSPSAGASTSEKLPYRGEILHRAAEVITKDRNNTYGEPEDALAKVAALWSAYLDRPMEAHDVAAMMALLKLARISNDEKHQDSWLDGIGYLAIGAEAVNSGGAEATKRRGTDG